MLLKVAYYELCIMMNDLAFSSTAESKFSTSQVSEIADMGVMGGWVGGWVVIAFH